MRKIIFFVSLWVLSFSWTYAQLPNYKSVSISEPAFNVGDFDNDGFLDAFSETCVMKNQGNLSFSKVLLPVTVTSRIDVCTDLDNDGDLDIACTHDVGYSIPILKNNGGTTFSSLRINYKSCFQHLTLDFDNDGKVDILSISRGSTSNTYQVLMYKNNGAMSFSEKVLITGITTTDLFTLDMQCYDYDGDGKQDIIVLTDKICTWYKNKGNLSFEKKSEVSSLYIGKQYDINADGMTDFVAENAVYINKGNNQFQTISLGMKATYRIVDLDNNGYLDLISGGQYIYLNNGKGGFDNYSSYTFQDAYDIGDPGDFNNDGRMDILGYNSGGVYTNTSSSPNSRPTFPTNLKAVVDGDSIVFTWDRATDNETPALGLTYNLRIGTTSGACDVMSALALANGKRLIPTQGNVKQNLSWTLKNIKQGATYYWSVQAIDNSFEGSAFAPEQTVKVFGNKIFPTQTVQLQTNKNSYKWGVEDNYTADTHQWKIGTQVGVYQDIVGETGTSYSTSFSQAGTYYLVCESRLASQNAISNAVTINVFAPQILLTSIPSSCFISRQKGYSFPLRYTLTGEYESDNEFVAYLYDAKGDFSKETKLNFIVSNTNGIFTFDIPGGTPDGLYVVRLKSSNPSVTSNISFNFVVDLNDAPYDIVLSNNKLAENQDIGTTVGTIQAKDLDTDDSFSYTLLSNSTNFILEGNRLKTNRLFDFETEPTVYTFAIKATDNHNTFCIQTFNIFIDNVNEAPTLNLPINVEGRENRDISITGFVVDDVDAFNQPLKVSISCENGVLRSDQLNANEILSGSQNSTSIVFQSTLTRVNEILNSLIYKSKRYFYGNVPFKISISDLGNTGIKLKNEETVDKILNVNVLPLPPEITIQPVSLIKGCVNDNTSFSVSADGIQPIEYQWFKDGSILYSEKKNSIRIDITSDENAGSYYCKIRNLGGEVVSNQGLLVIKSQNFTADIKPIKLCSGDPTGSILITASGGWGDYQYSIDNAKTFSDNPLYKDLHVGNYQVVIKDNNNCTTTKEFVVEAPPLLKPNVIQKNSSCKGYNNGELNVKVLGGTSPFTLDIQSISINERLNFDSNSSQKLYKNLIPAIYTISIKDKNQCDTFAVVRIIEPEKLSFVSSSKSVNCFGDHNGELTFTLNGGTEPYWVYWTNQEMTNLIKDFKSGTYQLSEVAKISNGLAAGKYDFYITDSQSCETSENVEIISPKPLEISFVDNTLTATGGTLPYQYSENGRSFSTTNRFDNLESGLHTLTIRDGRACMNSISQYIENKIVNGIKPSVDFQFVSQGLNVDLVSSIRNAKNWLWDFDDGTFSSEDINHHTYSKSGSYKVSLTVYNESGSSVIEKTITIIATNSITEIESNFKIYPNPTQDEFTVSIEATNSNPILTLFDSSARKVWEIAINQKDTKFSVTNLAKGIYTIQLKTNTKISTQKLVVY